MIERNAGVSVERRIDFRVGIHLGDVVEEDDGDLMGDGINIAARLEGICKPGGVCLSGTAYEHVRDRVKEAFVDLGDKMLKNIARPIRVYGISLASQRHPSELPSEKPALSLPDKPWIAVLPFQNMSGDPEQEYFADGMVEDIVTGLSRIKWLRDRPQLELRLQRQSRRCPPNWARTWCPIFARGQRAEGLGQRLRITAQLVEAESGRTSSG